MNSMIISFLIALVVVIFDTITKVIVMKNMNLGESFWVIPKFIKFTYVENTGMAFSMLSDSTWFLVIVSLVASVLLGYLVVKYSNWIKRKCFSLSLAFMLGGCVGNLIDRFLTVFHTRGGVVDFIEIYFGSFHAIGGSTFNVADAFLVVGCVLLIVEYAILEPLKERKKEKGNVIDGENNS